MVRSRSSCWLAIVRALVLAAGAFAALGSQAQASEAVTESSGPVYKIEIEGGIHPGAFSLLKHGIRTAEAGGAGMLVVRMDTPGGLLSTTRNIVAVMSKSTVPLVIYVGPTGAHAGSAGAFILLAGHVAAMQAGTNVGASSPIAGDGKEIPGVLGKKVLNDTKAFMRGIAESRGRDIATAEAFVADALSLTADEALGADVIDLVVEDFGDLLSKLDGHVVSIKGRAVSLQTADREVVAVDPRPIDRLLMVVANPQIAHLLVSLGSMGIFMEILAPGLAAPGIFGAIAMVLGMVGLHSLPVETGFMILLLLGVALMIAEYFASGFGILGIGGAIAFVVGSLNLFEEPLPAGAQQEILYTSVAVAAGMGVAVLLVTGRLLARLRPKGMRGKTGEAMVDFQEEGWVLVDNQRLKAKTATPLKHGDPVTVVDVDDDGHVKVEKG